MELSFNTQNIINIIILKKQGDYQSTVGSILSFLYTKVDLQYRANFGISVEVLERTLCDTYL